VGGLPIKHVDKVKELKNKNGDMRKQNIPAARDFFGASLFTPSQFF
jgi:hypothetical protein